MRLCTHFILCPKNIHTARVVTPAGELGTTFKNNLSRVIPLLPYPLFSLDQHYSPEEWRYYTLIYLLRTKHSWLLLFFSYNRLLVMFTQSERQQQIKIRWRGILIPRYHLQYIHCWLFTVSDYNTLYRISPSVTLAVKYVTKWLSRD